MKYKHFIILKDDSRVSRLAKESDLIGKPIYSSLKYFSRLKNDEVIELMNKPVRIDNQNNIIIISNGKYVSRINSEIIEKIISEDNADVLMLNLDENLEPYRENLRIQFDNEVAGYKRFFSDSIIPDAIPIDWPHYTIIKPSALHIINNCLPDHMHFCLFLKHCIFHNLKIKTFTVGGSSIDIETDKGILLIMKQYFELNNNIMADKNTRLYGNIIKADNAQIEDGAIVIGPSIIAENVFIPSSAAIYNSIICPDTKLHPNVFISNRIAGMHRPKSEKTAKQIITLHSFSNDTYRTWPLFSYARIGKRFCDIFISLIALPIFSIIFIIIAILIKISSPGPIFFGHKRQGIHGKPFFCLKFRTMITNADDIQEKLGSKNQVDGPQFKIDNDPRVTIIGRFLRDTHIDELPQFINILCGQMSLIGPRPSPIKENSFCSYWRDARLSVRPGVTGLWQISRTRETGQDFQEWIYYDTQYVKNLSFSEDIKIFFNTAIKLIFNFIKHF